MTTCDHKHPPNVICADRRCYWGERNAYLRLQRRLDRALNDLRRVRAFNAKATRGGGV